MHENETININHQSVSTVNSPERPGAARSYARYCLLALLVSVLIGLLMTGIGTTFGEAHVATMVSSCQVEDFVVECIFGKEKVLVLAEKLVTVGESSLLP